MAATRGKFITFEGGEGAGKSTQASRLAEALLARGLAVSTTREPGGTPFAEAARDLLLDPMTAASSPLAETLLFAAARADHLELLIRPALAEGTWVICDRFIDSTRVYQGYAGGVAFPVLDVLEQAVVQPDYPDLTLIIDMDPAESLARAHARRLQNDDATTADSFERRSLQFHQVLRDGFRQIAEEHPKRCILINGEGSIEDVAARVHAETFAFFGLE